MKTKKRSSRSKTRKTIIHALAGCCAMGLCGPEAAEASRQETHTRGPWGISKHAVPDGIYQSGIYAQDSGKDLAIVRTSEANARLIAAAPDLLEALHQCCRAAADCLPMSEDKTPVDKLYYIAKLRAIDAAAAQASAAIAKATGKGGE